MYYLFYFIFLNNVYASLLLIIYYILIAASFYNYFFSEYKYIFYYGISKTNYFIKLKKYFIFEIHHKVLISLNKMIRDIFINLKILFYLSAFQSCINFLIILPFIKVKQIFFVFFPKSFQIFYFYTIFLWYFLHLF